jgi:excisionase family DNA binding protein
MMTWNEVAAQLRVSPRHARRVARRIGLVPIRLGHRTVRFSRAEVQEALQRIFG